MKAVLDLAERWRSEAALLEAHGATEAAATARLHAQQLADTLRAGEDEALTLHEASTESGLSERRLRELLASGDVPQAGQRGRPRIRRGDLPRRRLGGGRHDGFDASAHARSIMGAS